MSGLPPPGRIPSGAKPRAVQHWKYGEGGPIETTNFVFPLTLRPSTPSTKAEEHNQRTRGGAKHGSGSSGKWLTASFCPTCTVSTAGWLMRAVRCKFPPAALEREEFAGSWASGRLQIRHHGRVPAGFCGSDLGDWREPG